MAPSEESLLPPGARLERVATGATWSEGPVWLDDPGVVRWSDIPGNRILEYRPADGSCRVHREDVEFTNGRTLDLDGTVLQCSHGRRAVEREVDGVPETLVDRWNGVRFNSPNDIVVSSDGAVWFTDPAYGIVQPAEGHPGEREYRDHYVFRFVPATGELHPVIMDMEDPNGLAFSPDESVLYVSDTSAALVPGGRHHIRAYDVVDGRRCKYGRTLAVIEPGVPDGFRVDVEGRIWTSSEDAVQVLDAEGRVLQRIPVPERVGNLCFGGPDGRDLYIAASTSLYRISTTTTDAARRR
ncbi:SMP-30/gluconolactonase/LRE family protein [Paenarthrobacter sp. DKR-5]|uniref:SMP-30/gluconolactonase/LRE family protein n=1 Tax=Paenarthrobacter sp. DKR-5 TaxID=2835535 RepID=UPI0027DC3A69|nr:SMP-30/gluconolactonase/LRE family protein [Paenarthrobacter sp. DKR-5]